MEYISGYMIADYQTELYENLNNFALENADSRVGRLKGRMLSIPVAVADVAMETLKRPCDAIQMAFLSLSELKKCVTGFGSFKKAVILADSAIIFGIIVPTTFMMAPYKLVYQILAGVYDPSHVKSFSPQVKSPQSALKIIKIQSQCYKKMAKESNPLAKKALGAIFGVVDVSLELGKMYASALERTALVVINVFGCPFRTECTVKSAIDNAERALGTIATLPYAWSSTLYKMTYQVAMNVLYPNTARPFGEYPH